MRVLADMTGETLRLWRESKGWDVPRMARELRKAARDTGEDVAAHHGLVKMIPQWERGGRAPRERYRLLKLSMCQTKGRLRECDAVNSGSVKGHFPVQIRLNRATHCQPCPVKSSCSKMVV